MHLHVGCALANTGTWRGADWPEVFHTKLQNSASMLPPGHAMNCSALPLGTGKRLPQFIKCSNSPRGDHKCSIVASLWLIIESDVAESIGWSRSRTAFRAAFAGLRLAVRAPRLLACAPCWCAPTEGVRPSDVCMAAGLSPVQMTATPRAGSLLDGFQNRRRSYPTTG